MQSKTSLRERFGQYRVAGGIPDQAADDPERPMWLRTFGALLVGFIGFALTAPVVIATLDVFARGNVPDLALWALALGMAPASMVVGTFVGGPLVDHLLGVSREVSG